MKNTIKFIVKQGFVGSRFSNPHSFHGATSRVLVNPLVRMGLVRTDTFSEAHFIVWISSYGYTGGGVKKEEELLALARKHNKPVVMSLSSGVYKVLCDAGIVDSDDPMVIGIRNAFSPEGNVVRYWGESDFRPLDEKGPLSPLPAENTCVYIGHRRVDRLFPLAQYLNSATDHLVGPDWREKDYRGRVRPEQIPYDCVAREISKYRYVFHASETLFNKVGILCIRVDEALRAGRLVLANASNPVHAEVLPARCVYGGPVDFETRRQELMDPAVYGATFAEFKEKYTRWCAANAFDPKLMRKKLVMAGLDVY